MELLYMHKWLSNDADCNWYYLKPMSHGQDQSALLFLILWSHEEMNKCRWHFIRVSSSYLLAQHITWNIRLVWLTFTATVLSSVVVLIKRTKKHLLPTKLLKPRILIIFCKQSLYSIANIDNCFEWNASDAWCFHKLLNAYRRTTPVSASSPSEIALSSQMLWKFDHVYTLVDLRLHF